MTDPKLTLSELGKISAYDTSYNPNRLFPFPRQDNRDTLGIDSAQLPFYGFDYWSHYEVSWLNLKGKPIVATASIIYSCDSQNIIESKSMKLYFNSFNNMQLENVAAFETMVTHDLKLRLNTPFLSVKITPSTSWQAEPLLPHFNGTNLDTLDISCDTYHTDPSFLTTENDAVEEQLYSDLLKANCLITNQPDWGSIQIAYKGRKINHAGLLRYIVSFRHDNEFHEQCIEKMFVHIMQRCAPEHLTIYGHWLRRGGIDINALRSTERVEAGAVINGRLFRQ